MNKGKLLAAVGVVAAAYVVAAPYITVYQMRTAAENSDGEALSEHIDFPSVRQSMKDQMNVMFMKRMSSDEMKDNPFAGVGMAFAGVMVDKMVDAIITPAGIAEMMKGKKPAPTEKNDPPGDSAESGSTRKPFDNASMAYESTSKFVIAVRNDSGDDGKFVLRRNGIDWKLAEVIIPMEN